MEIELTLKDKELEFSNKQTSVLHKINQNYLDRLRNIANGSLNFIELPKESDGPDTNKN